MSHPSAEGRATFSGTLSDGSNATAEHVLVRPGKEGLNILTEDGSQLFWAWQDIVTSGALRKGQPPLLSHRECPDSRLFISDPAIVRPLLRHVPRLGTRARKKRLLWPMLAAAAFILLLLALPWVTGFSTARFIADMLPREMHATLGRSLVRQMSLGGRVCVQPQGKAALHTLTRRLAGDAARTDDIRVFVAPLGLVNAFTTPGGYVIIADELLRQARTPDEVAGVLAHEMGHAIHHHPEAALVRAGGLSLLGALLFGDSNIGNLAVVLAQLGYSRRAEREADETGIALLHRANIDPGGLIAFFRRMQAKHGTGGGNDLTALFRTHPATGVRIRMLQKARLRNAPPALSAEAWRALRGICKQRRPFLQADD